MLLDFLSFCNVLKDLNAISRLFLWKNQVSRHKPQKLLKRCLLMYNQYNFLSSLSIGGIMFNVLVNSDGNLVKLQHIPLAFLFYLLNDALARE